MHPKKPADKKLWLAFVFLGLLAVTVGSLIPKLAHAERVKLESSESAEKPASGASALAYTPPAQPDLPSAQTLLTRLAVGTVAVLIVCVLTILLGKRWLLVTPSTQPGQNKLAIVETLKLDNRSSLLLVAVGSQQLIVGLDATGIKHIAPLPELFAEPLAELTSPTELSASTASAVSTLAAA